MRKLILTSILCCLPFVSATADTMVVKVPVLNVRQCPSTDCKIVNKLSRGDKIEITNVTKGWAEIKSDDEKAYVVSRSLRKSYSYLWYWVIGIISLIVIGNRLSAIEEKKEREKRRKLAEYEREEKRKLDTQCPKCKTLGAMTEVKRECVDHKKSTIIKTTRTQYKDYTKTQEHLVPATTYIYKVTSACTNCGHTVISTDSEKRED